MVIGRKQSAVEMWAVSKMKAVDLIYFHFPFDLFSIFLFLEPRVRVRVTWSQVTRYMEGHRRFWKDNIIQYVQHILTLRQTYGCLG